MKKTNVKFSKILFYNHVKYIEVYTVYLKTRYFIFTSLIQMLWKIVIHNIYN